MVSFNNLISYSIYFGNSLYQPADVYSKKRKKITGTRLARGSCLKIYILAMQRVVIDIFSHTSHCQGYERIAVKVIDCQSICLQYPTKEFEYALKQKGYYLFQLNFYFILFFHFQNSSIMEFSRFGKIKLHYFHYFILFLRL